MRKSFGNNNHRLLRVNELIKRGLSEIIRTLDWEEEDLKGLSLTITEVCCSKDIRNAKVFYVPVGRENSAQIKNAIEKKKGEIKKFLGKNLQLKYVPKLRFLEDKSFENYRNTSELLKTLKQTEL